MSRLLVLLSALCFATTGTAQALGAPAASPVTVGAARLLVGAAGLQLAAWWVTRRSFGEVGGPPLPSEAGRPLPRPQPGWLGRLLPLSPRLWPAALGVAAYQVTFFLAVRTTGVAVGTVVALGSAPVLTGVLGVLSGQGRPGRRWAGATALAVSGLAVLTVSGAASQVHPAGVLLAVGAAASYAVYTVGAKAALDAGGGAERTMAQIFTGGALLLSPALVLLDTGWLVTPRGALTAAWLGVVPTALAYVLFARGLRGVTAAEASTLTLAEPLTAAGLGVAVLGESVTGAALVGAVLLLLGLVVLAAPRGGAPRPTRPAVAR